MALGSAPDEEDGPAEASAAAPDEGFEDVDPPPVILLRSPAFFCFCCSFRESAFFALFLPLQL